MSVKPWNTGIHPGETELNGSYDHVHEFAVVWLAIFFAPCVVAVEMNTSVSNGSVAGV